MVVLRNDMKLLARRNKAW